jgi:hypothetical protein
MQKKQLMDRRPAYRNGQLLLENDFIEEQQYHTHARYAHARNLHGFGIVQGLEISPAGGRAVSVSPGVAIDRRGREIELRQTETLQLNQLAAGTLAWVTIGFRAERGNVGGEESNRIDCYAYLRVATGVEEHDVRLGSVQLDDHGNLVPDPGRKDRDVLQTHLAPGSITAEALSPELRRGWIPMAFHPSDIPEDDEHTRPPFRVGATRAETLRKINGKENNNGAGGTMGLALPPGIQTLHRFRIAGAANEGKLTVMLLKGGFNEAAKEHVRDIVLNIEIPPGKYFHTADIPPEHQDLKDPLRTLAVDIRASAYSAISLIALEVSH